MTQTTLAVVADPHINSAVGLCTPVVNLDDGGTYHVNRGQRWLWECWLDYCGKVAAAPGRKVAILNGDLGELDTKRRSVQIISANKATIMRLVADVLEPIISIVDAVYIIRGTAAHVGKSAWLEEALAEDTTNAVHSPEAASWWHLRATVENVRIDVAHHASMGGLPWTAKNAVMRLAIKTVVQYAEYYHQPPPDLVIRSDRHRTADSYTNYSTRALFTPAWCLPNEYTYRVGFENEVADIGAMLITCQDNGYVYTGPELYRPKGYQKIWSMKI